MKFVEHRIQCEIHGWLEKHFDCEVVAVPNGGFRGRMEAVRLKAEGVQAGHPDLIVYGADANVILIEVKTEKGPLTESQKLFFPRLADLGFPTLVARSLDDVKAVAMDWGIPPRAIKPRSAAELASGF